MFAAVSAGIEESLYFFPTSAAALRAAALVCSKLLSCFSAEEIALQAEMMSLSPTGRGRSTVFRRLPPEGTTPFDNRPVVFNLLFKFVHLCPDTGMFYHQTKQ